MALFNRKSLSANTLLRVFGLTKVPMILYCWPSVLELSDARCAIKIPLTWRTKNHLGSMYFGALAVGADIAGGLLAIKLAGEASRKVSFVFADIKGEFLKRAEGDVHFVSEDGLAIKEFVTRVLNSSERQSIPVTITATVPSKFGEEPVARFTLTLSMKAV